MRILVTGGAGFIGSNLVCHLLRQTGSSEIEKVVTLDALGYSGNLANLAEVQNDPRHVFVKGSIVDEPLVRSLLEDHQIETVFHLAAETHVDRSIDSSEPFFQSNVIGTLRLAEACRRYWSSLRAADRAAFRLLHVSTDEVFGSLEPDDPPFSETTPYAPRSPYAASKAASDHLINAYWHTYQLPVVLSNCSNNYGPRQFPEKLIPLVILSALHGRALPIYGDGLQCRDWLHVEDHCRALELIARRGRLGESYGVGSGDDSRITNLKIVGAICDILDRHAPRADGKSYTTQIVHVPDRPGHDRRYAISIAKISSELKWQPRETLSSGLEKTVLWYVKNQQWSEAIASRTDFLARLGTADARSTETAT
jgi:dTDP-glucose 4,6-dehydratase